ncbi:PD-(D/E)XK nuclease-like domain-containing protein [Spirosoma sp. 48-14]|uniref:PD-(D/E)XK nuclease-like domain-containing protein n=1 Tax=Spirosoma sp. 48-14 TaxID=1895854 RepID=UPI00095E8578|nr:PD-(D/E)XK nuclease-like domain-containing protein [Spirosoma sp. 48-14]OJW78417.1 MAG: hypothetical protein BGO59_30925 [Spirosoma sp. 48-14]
MTDEAYRQLPRYSNSDLLELSRVMLPTFEKNKPIDPKTALFGTFFHAMILEPEKELDWSLIHVKERYKLMQMVENFVKSVDEFTLDCIKQGKSEVVKLWDCPITGLPLKAKLDNVFAGTNLPIQGPLIIDLKTTSYRNPQDFYDSIIKYGYDRQAAFYLDSLGIERNYNFRFVCVQKNSPFTVFEINLALSADRKKIVDEGRKKNAFWLRKAAEEAKKPNGWKPSSWSRKPELVA